MSLAMSVMLSPRSSRSITMNCVSLRRAASFVSVIVFAVFLGTAVFFPFAYTQLMKREHRLADTDELERAHRAFAAHPDNVGARFQLARCLYMHGMVAHAVAIAEEAVSGLSEEVDPVSNRSYRDMFRSEIFHARQWKAMLKPEGERLRLLVRVPLVAMRDMAYPQRGSVDLLDLARAERTLRDAATLWIADDIELYEDDVFAWTQLQARELRRFARTRPNLPLDLPHIAEEIADLGKERRDALRSWTARIIEHLLLLEHSPAREPRRGWIEETVNFRSEIERRLTATLHRDLKRRLPHLYAEARRNLQRELDRYGGLADRPRLVVLNKVDLFRRISDFS